MNICMYSTRMAATVSTYAHLYAFMTYTVHLLSKDGAMFTYQKVTGKKSDYQVIT